MLSQPDKDVHIDAVHIEFFERYARGNKVYYSAGLGSGASEAISFCLVNLTPLIVWLVLMPTLLLERNSAAPAL